MPYTREIEIFEIYKLHAELADRVSQRREGANRIYVSLLVVFVMFLGALLRFGSGPIPVTPFLFMFGVLGSLISLSWYVVIRSYRQLNSGKFLALHELEKELPYPFFTREWELLAKGKKVSRYWKLTVVEVGLPIIFLTLFCFVIAYALFQ